MRREPGRGTSALSTGARYQFSDAAAVRMNGGTAHPPHDVTGFRRPPSEVMRLERLGCAHPSRLSFLHTLLRRVTRDGWSFDRPLWQIDANGVGRAVYRARGPERTYSLVAFAHDLPDDMRSDRVIATAWDATFTLFDGVPTLDDLDRLERNVPLQEAGRISTRELSLSRANRSVRLFAHVVERLAGGRQPDLAEVEAVGYLMRTTAVYGSGKFGAADWIEVAHRPELGAPFQVEMLSVWLTRQFTVDIAEHLAEARGGSRAVRLAPHIRRALGVGNSTGLGMAPFLVRHPVLLNNWMMAREEALARVRAQDRCHPEALVRFRSATEDACRNADAWRSAHPVQIEKLEALRVDLSRLAAAAAETLGPDGHLPWDRLWRYGETELSVEGQEALLSLMLEAHPDLVDPLSGCMTANEIAAFRIDGTMRVAELSAILMETYDWALSIDFDKPENAARFWYVSEEKLEPRIGSRFDEAGADAELPLCIARLACEMHRELSTRPDGESLAAFLLEHPEHRFMARRAQIASRHPYAEIRDNLIAREMLPIDLMRCKLAFFGASRFDPRSDQWVRISLFQDQPYPSDLASEDWCAPGQLEVSEAGSILSDSSTGVCLSRNEIEQLGLKAARGAGMSWGLAEEAGFAAAWLAHHGLPGPCALLRRLAEGEDHPLHDLRFDQETRSWDHRGRACPIALGAALCDHVKLSEVGNMTSTVQLGEIGQPLLLLPFLAEAARMTDGNICLRWSGGTITVTNDGGIFGSLRALKKASWLDAEVSATAADPGSGHSMPGVHSVPFETLQGLEAHALRITVPASETSRAGAGASSDDND